MWATSRTGHSKLRDMKRHYPIALGIVAVLFASIKERCSPLMGKWACVNSVLPQSLTLFFSIHPYPYQIPTSAPSQAPHTPTPPHTCREAEGVRREVDVAEPRQA